MQSNKGQFKKGTSGNSNGRPKVTNANIRELASRDSTKAYKLLWKAVQASEPWAMDIFFREFLSKEEVHALVNANEENPLTVLRALS